MRSGTRSQCKSRWSRKAHRPVCHMKVGYQFCYLYAALCPFTGHLFSLILPDMRKASFCLFSKYFSQHVKRRYRKAPVLLIADGAGAHQTDVCLRYGITLQRLPAACPELNPVERFFEELRKEMSNHVCHTIKSVENHLCRVLNKYYHNKKLLIQLCQYPYTRT
ncbi:transposase [Flavisolibacter sp. BT320]|nr:transposase [Flavisolibacter longurius]